MQTTSLLTRLSAATLLLAFISCTNATQQEGASNVAAVAVTESGQSAVKDDESQKNVLQVAVASKDHSTLVTAVKAGELTNALSNAGPFTVFAPTNAAFDKLPAGTVEDLLKPEKKETLQNILQYHVSLGVFKTDNLHDGQIIGQANGDNITITVKDGKYYVNGAEIIASVPASNGLIHVIDQVLLPGKK